MIFNKDKFFNRNVQSLKDDLLYISIKEFTELVKKTTLPEQEEEDLPETTIKNKPKFIISSSFDIIIKTRKDEELEA